MSRSSSPFVRVTAILIGIGAVSVMLFLVAEGAIRFIQFLRHGSVVGAGELIVFDQSVGLRVLAPGGRSGSISINELGFRGGEVSLPKPPGRIRLAFLGASTTYCAEVSGNEKVWPHLVSEMLKQRFPNREFDYVNAGVPGYTVQSSLRSLQLRVAKTEPDVLIIYHATNDLSNNASALAWKQGIGADMNRGFLRDAFVWIKQNSLLVYLAEKNLTILARQRSLASGEGAAQDGQHLFFDEAELGGPFERDLRALVEESMNLSKRVVLITFSQQLRRDQTKERQLEAAATHAYYFPHFSIEHLLDGFDLYNFIIRKMGSEYDVLLVEKEEGILGNEANFVDSVHFSDTGSQAMAERVYEALTSDAHFIGLVQSVPEP